MADGDGAVATRDPDALVKEIERTRENLARTIDSLTERVSPANAARRVATRAREQAARPGMWVHNRLRSICCRKRGGNRCTGVCGVQLRKVLVGHAEWDVGSGEVAGPDNGTAGDLVIVNGVGFERAGIVPAIDSS